MQTAELQYPVQEEDTVLELRVRLSGGGVRALPAIAGMTLMELLRANGVPVIAECGGAAVCATCHIRISQAWLDRVPAPSDEELAKLDDIPQAGDSSRLACQITMTDALDRLEIDLQADSIKS